MTKLLKLTTFGSQLIYWAIICKKILVTAALLLLFTQCYRVIFIDNINDGCLVRKDDALDAATFWTSIDSDAELDHCLRAQLSGRSPDSTREWFTQMGFNAKIRSESRNKESQVYIIEAYWLVDKHGKIYPSNGFFHWLSKIYIQSQLIRVQMSNDGVVEKISSRLLAL